MRYQKVIRHGNSLAVVIPAAYCRELGIHRGDAIRMTTILKENDEGKFAAIYLRVEAVVENTDFGVPKKHG